MRSTASAKGADRMKAQKQATDALTDVAIETLTQLMQVGDHATRLTAALTALELLHRLPPGGARRAR